MEFEGDKPISEAERQLAGARQKTITPLHTDVTPETLPDSAVVASHISNVAIGNVAGDIEQDAPLIHPTASIAEAIASEPTKKGTALRTTLTSVGLVLFVLMIVFVVLQQ